MDTDTGTNSSQVDALAVDAPSRIPQVDELAVDAPSRIPQVDELAVDAPSRIPQVDELAGTLLILDTLPWPVSRAPPAAYPATEPPTPAPGDLGVIEIRLTEHPRRKRLALVDEPAMTGRHVGFVHWLVTPPGYLVWRGLQGTKEISEEAIFVVHRLNAWRMGTIEEDGSTPKEGLHIIHNRPETLPDEVCSS